MNMFIVWMITCLIASVICGFCIPIVKKAEMITFFVGLTIPFTIALLVLTFTESHREEALNRYVIVKSVTYGDTDNTFRYITNYPAFEFLSDSLIYKPGDTVWLGSK